MLPPYRASSRFSQRKESAESSTSGQPVQQVGIWYSPADEKVAKRLHIHLQPKVRQGFIKLWDTNQIQPDALLQDERARALRSVAVAIVLVSADLMASDAIICHELPQLLHRAMAQGTIILLLHVNSCDITNSGLERFYPLNPPEKPLAKMERPDREKVLAQATRTVCQRLGINL